MLYVIWDAGHGLKTAGKRVPLAMGYGDIAEWTLNDRIVRYAMKELGTYKDVQQIRVDDPTGKIDIPLRERTTIANNWVKDPKNLLAYVYMSVHTNAFESKPFDGGGITVYAHPNASTKSKELQKVLYNELIAETGLKGNRYTGIPTANFHVLRETNMPAILSENGFMDSRIDIKIITTDTFARQAAKAHVASLVKVYKLKKKLLPIPSPETPVDKTLYRVQVGAYARKGNATNMEKKLKADGFDTYVIQGIDNLFRVQTGAFAIKDNALTLEKKLKSLKYDTYITTNQVNVANPEGNAPVVVQPIIKIGSKVRIKATAAKYATGENIPKAYKGKDSRIDTVRQQRTRNSKKEALLTTLNSWVFESDLELV